jgi:hypothetical protein
MPKPRDEYDDFYDDNNLSSSQSRPRRDLPDNWTKVIVAIIAGILGIFGCLTITFAITLQLTGNLDPLICRWAGTCETEASVVAAATNTPIVPTQIVITATPQVQPTRTQEVVVVTATPPELNQSATAVNNLSRTAALEKYDRIYDQEGWCSAWSELSTDGLVNGECPELLAPYFEGNQILAGAQVRTNSPTEIIYPSCVQYGSSLAFLEEGQAIDGPDLLKESTDSRFSTGSLFTLYFRCEIVPRINQLHNSQ